MDHGGADLDFGYMVETSTVVNGKTVRKWMQVVSTNQQIQHTVLKVHIDGVTREQAQSNVVSGWVQTAYTVDHQFPSAQIQDQPYVVKFKGCCRLGYLDAHASTNRNVAGGAFTLGMTVDFKARALLGTSSQVNRSPIARIGNGIIGVVANVEYPQKFRIPVVDHDNDADIERTEEKERDVIGCYAGNQEDYGIGTMMNSRTYFPEAKRPDQCLDDGICEDDPAFVDMNGYRCDEWAYYDCHKNPTGFTYTTAQLQDVRDHCKRTCGVCTTCLYDWLPAPHNGNEPAAFKVDRDSCVVTLTTTLPECADKGEKTQGCYSLVVKVYDFASRADREVGITKAKSSMSVNLLIQSRKQINAAGELIRPSFVSGIEFNGKDVYVADIYASNQIEQPSATFPEALAVHPTWTSQWGASYDAQNIDGFAVTCLVNEPCKITVKSVTAGGDMDLAGGHVKRAFTPSQTQSMNEGPAFTGDIYPVVVSASEQVTATLADPVWSTGSEREITQKALDGPSPAFVQQAQCLSTDVATDFACTCEDNKLFLDAAGFACGDWTGSNCDADQEGVGKPLWSAGFTKDQIRAVAAACPATCALCLKIDRVERTEKVGVAMLNPTASNKLDTLSKYISYLQNMGGDYVEETFSYTPTNDDICESQILCFAAEDTGVHTRQSNNVCGTVSYLSQPPFWETFSKAVNGISSKNTPDHNSVIDVYIDEEFKMTMRASDPNPGYKLQISVLADPAQPTHSRFERETGIFTWNPHKAQVGKSKICFMAQVVDINCDHHKSPVRCVYLNVVEPKPAFKVGAPAASYIGRVGYELIFDVTIEELNKKAAVATAAAPAKAGRRQLEQTAAKSGVYNLKLMSGSTYVNPSHKLPKGASFEVIENGAPPVTSKFIWRPVRGQESFSFKVCFTGGDVFERKIVSQCTTIPVERCKYVVRDGDTLRSIAEDYDTDYLQLWAANPWIRNPDSMIPQNTALYVGVIYTVRTGDTLRDLAQRFQHHYANIDRLFAVNPDLYYDVVTLPSQEKKPRGPDYDMLKPGDNLCVTLPICTYKYPFVHTFGSTGTGLDNGGRDEHNSLTTMGQVGTLDEQNEDRGSIGRMLKGGNSGNDPAIAENTP